jgi:hypothetical protein
MQRAAVPHVLCGCLSGMSRQTLSGRPAAMSPEHGCICRLSPRRLATISFGSVSKLTRSAGASVLVRPMKCAGTSAVRALQISRFCRGDNDCCSTVLQLSCSRLNSI